MQYDPELTDVGCEKPIRKYLSISSDARRRGRTKSKVSIDNSFAENLSANQTEFTTPELNYFY